MQLETLKKDFFTLVNKIKDYKFFGSKLKKPENQNNKKYQQKIAIIL